MKISQTIIINILLILIVFILTYIYEIEGFTGDKVLGFVFIIVFITSCTWSIYFSYGKKFRKYLLFILFSILFFPLIYYLTYYFNGEQIDNIIIYIGGFLILFYWLLFVIIKLILKFIYNKIFIKKQNNDKKKLN